MVSCCKDDGLGTCGLWHLMDLLQFSSAGSIDFTAFDVVETHSAKIWLGALCVDRAFSFILLQSLVRLTDDSCGEWFCG
jgi:hypothetical protein